MASSGIPDSLGERGVRPLLDPMRVTRMIVAALTFAATAVPRDGDILLGRWNCSVRQSMKAQSGRVVGSSASEFSIEFGNDHTATIGGGGGPGKAQGSNAHWSGAPDKLVVQPDGGNRITGGIKGDSLKMQGDQLNPDRDLLIHTDWTCKKVR